MTTVFEGDNALDSTPFPQIQVIQENTTRKPILLTFLLGNKVRR